MGPDRGYWDLWGEGTVEAIEFRVSFSHFTEKDPGAREAQQTHTFPPPGLAHTHCNEQVCQDDVPAQLPSVGFDQCLPRGKEALGVLVADGGPSVWQLAQEGPAMGREAPSDEGLGLWLQRADLRGRCHWVELQSKEEVIHSLLRGHKGGGGRQRSARCSSQCLEGTLEATESRVSSSRFTEKDLGERGAGQTPMFPPTPEGIGSPVPALPQLWGVARMRAHLVGDTRQSTLQLPERIRKGGRERWSGTPGRPCTERTTVGQQVAQGVCSLEEGVGFHGSDYDVGQEAPEAGLPWESPASDP